MKLTGGLGNEGRTTKSRAEVLPPGFFMPFVEWRPGADVSGEPANRGVSIISPKKQALVMDQGLWGFCGAAAQN